MRKREREEGRKGGREEGKERGGGRREQKGAHGKEGEIKVPLLLIVIFYLLLFLFVCLRTKQIFNWISLSLLFYVSFNFAVFLFSPCVYQNSLIYE